MLTAGSYAQTTTTTTTTERIKIVPAGEPAATDPKNIVKKVQTPAEELESCETQLDALIKKEAYIRSNPEELKLAEENGWFTDAAITKATLEKRINELKIQLKK